MHKEVPGLFQLCHVHAAHLVLIPPQRFDVIVSRLFSRLSSTHDFAFRRHNANWYVRMQRGGVNAQCSSVSG